MKISKILCPVDFSDSSSEALKYAAFLAEKHEAEMFLLHVIEHFHHSDDYMILAMTSKEAYEKWEEEAEIKLETLEAEFGQKVKMTHDIREGKAFIEIIRAAKEENADLIVMGSHGRTFLPQILIGSVAEKVVRKARCPVLIVRNAEAEFELP